MKSTIGNGEYARVILATAQDDTSKSIALKVINKSKILRVWHLERLEFEIRILKILGSRHYNIIQCYDVYHSHHFLYLALERFGIDLFEFYNRRKKEFQGTRPPLSIKEICEIAFDIFDAIAYCHAHGVVHRDIKPDNVLIQYDIIPISNSTASPNSSIPIITIHIVAEEELLAGKC